MDNQINPLFNFNNKTYKTLSGAKSARTRYIKKRINELRKTLVIDENGTENERITRKITKLENQLISDKNEAKKKQKENRLKAQFFKNNFEIENNAPQKLTIDERRIRRNRAIEENRIPINGLNFQEKRDIRRVYEVRALGGRITENYINDRLHGITTEKEK